MENSSIESFFKIAAFFFSLYQLKNLGLFARLRLKTDLEILKILEKDEVNALKIKARVDESVEKIYGDARFKIYYRGEFFIYLLGAVGYVYFSYVSFASKHLFWGFLSLLISFFCFAALFNTLKSPKRRLEEMGQKRQP